MYNFYNFKIYFSHFQLNVQFGDLNQNKVLDINQYQLLIAFICEI